MDLSDQANVLFLTILHIINDKTSPFGAKSKQNPYLVQTNILFCQGTHREEGTRMILLFSRTD